MKILIIEDEFNLADVVATRLKKEKYSVDISNDGEIMIGMTANVELTINS